MGWHNDQGRRFQGIEAMVLTQVEEIFAAAFSGGTQGQDQWGGERLSCALWQRGLCGPVLRVIWPVPGLSGDPASPPFSCPFVPESATISTACHGTDAAGGFPLLIHRRGRCYGAGTSHRMKLGVKRMPTQDLGQIVILNGTPSVR